MSGDETPDTSPPQNAPPTHRPRRWLMPVGALGVLLLISLYPLYAWQRVGLDRAESLSNIRRVGTGALLYAQDWDSRLPPIATQRDDQRWDTWPTLIRKYVDGPDSTFSNPANPVNPFHSTVKHPRFGYPIDSSYALNRRFWDTFSSGPFPLDNLEMPEQTALLVEAGPMWGEPRREISPSHLGLLDYGDMMDRVQGLVPYPTTHDERMAVVAADGHGLMVTVEHYDRKNGPHDPRYGRIGQNIYNWNGGHPNGETDLSTRE